MSNALEAYISMILIQRFDDSTSDALTNLSCVYSNASHIFLKLDGACIQMPPRSWN